MRVSSRRALCFWRGRLGDTVVKAPTAKREAVTGEDGFVLGSHAFVEGPAFHATSDGIIVVDADGCITSANEAAERMLGCLAHDMHGRPVHAFLHAVDWGTGVRKERGAALGKEGEQDGPAPSGYGDGCPACEPLRDGRAHRELSGVFRRRDGSEFHVKYNVEPLAGSGGAVVAFADVTDRVHQQGEMERLQAIIEGSPDFVAVAKTDGHIAYVNKAGRRLLGLGDDEPLCNVHIMDLYTEASARLVLDEGLTAAAEEGLWRGETVLAGNDGRHIPSLQLIVSHKNEAGEVEFFSTVHRDISEQKQMEEQLRYLATHDTLTGLMNRARFQDYLRRDVERAVAEGVPGAMLYIDLDNFHQVNDSIGHWAGDALLRCVAQTMQAEMREGDRLARLGGDEFAVLLPRTSEAEAKKIGMRLLHLVSQEAVSFGGRVVRAQASVGIASYPHPAPTMEDVLVNADLALYVAKRRGGNRCIVYDQAQNWRLRVQTHLDWDQLCREALDEDRFTLHWQPLLHLGTGQVTGYELLVRMIAPDGDLVAPGHFLPVCERSGLINAIDRWVLRRALQLRAELDGRGAHDIRLHVNLSRKTLSDESMVAFVQDRLDEVGVDPSRIVLELTETAAAENVSQATAFMNGLREMGFRFALDDFGVGFSSFGALRRWPVDFVKIDGSFIRDLREDATSQHLVKAMVDAARGLDKRIVAEFVPDEHTLDLLRTYGVDYGQGYFIGPPRPIDGS